AWERPLDFGDKEYGMFYVGNNWFRWRGMQRVLKSIEPIREQVGRIGIVGHGWSSPAPWAHPSLTEDAYYNDPGYLTKLGVEVMPPIHFHEVIAGMSNGTFTPVIYRPLFDFLQLVTCRTFETLAASTIPLFTQDAANVEEVFGEKSVELVLPEDRAQEKILDILGRPEQYAPIVQGIRRHLAEKHSYAARLRELIQIIEE
ncbi:MAG: glycosyltransferase family 1 protein, partial [Chloroflexi bacterium]|nr:glycosyltransferase family 1 protein [Chloroflexota bacterium]